MLALQLYTKFPVEICRIIVDQTYVDPRIIDLIMDTMYDAEVTASMLDNFGDTWTISPSVSRCGGLCGVRTSHVNIIIRCNGGYSWSVLGIQNLFKNDANLSDDSIISLDHTNTGPLINGDINPMLTAALRRKLHQLL